MAEGLRKMAGEFPECFGNYGLYSECEICDWADDCMEQSGIESKGKPRPNRFEQRKRRAG